MKNLIQWNSEYLYDKDRELPCIICGRPTHFVEIFFEGRICSEKCQKEIDKDFVEWCKKYPLEEGDF